MSFFFWLKIKIKRTESNENTLTILAFYFLLITTYNNWLTKKMKMRWTYSKIFLKQIDIKICCCPSFNRIFKYKDSQKNKRLDGRS